VWSWASSADSGNTQVLHWNGKKWSSVAAPDVSCSDFLFGIAAASATSAWAVGEAKGNQTLALHWGGKSWKVAKVPSPGSGDFLNGVTATSASKRLGGGVHRRRHVADPALERDLVEGELVGRRWHGWFSAAGTWGEPDPAAEGE
jgi:hypothetical protein